MTNGYSRDTEMYLMPWQNCDEDPEIATPTDVAIDQDARQWLQLSPADAAPLTGIYWLHLKFNVRL